MTNLPKDPAAAVPQAPCEAGGPSCRICSDIWEEVFSFFCQFQYALAKDPVTQAEFRASFGLCPAHTWLLEQLSSPRGRCESFPGLLEDLSGRLLALAGLPGRQASQSLGALLGNPGKCAACRTKALVEHQAIQRVHRDLKTDPDCPVNLCLPHLSVILQEAGESASAALIRHQARRLADQARAMRSYAVKFDALKRGDTTPEEDISPRVALELLVGVRTLSSLRALE
jgi:hypothetical protein